MRRGGGAAEEPGGAATAGGAEAEALGPPLGATAGTGKGGGGASEDEGHGGYRDAIDRDGGARPCRGRPAPPEVQRSPRDQREDDEADEPEQDRGRPARRQLPRFAGVRRRLPMKVSGTRGGAVTMPTCDHGAVCAAPDGATKGADARSLAGAPAIDQLAVGAGRRGGRENAGRMLRRTDVTRDSDVARRRAPLRVGVRGEHGPIVGGRRVATRRARTSRPSPWPTRSARRDPFGRRTGTKRRSPATAPERRATGAEDPAG